MTLPIKIKNAILAHAKKESPKECCGLVAVVQGRQRYFPCKNIADTPNEHFVLDPVDYAAVEDKGEITAVIHSHPGVPADPSPADRVACEESGLPWHIVNPLTEAWGYCEPVGFELPYVGRKFVYGIVDCWTLVRDWYKREQGIELRNYSRREGWEDRGENLYTVYLPHEGFREIPITEAEPGDVILMQLVSHVPNHGAIYLGNQQILHHVQGRLSSRDIFGGGGYYLKNTAGAWRHESR